ncbi:MAG: hypothetical protein KC620_24225, partial [Myxococcales bacterium]|nr:hypothetical protein [Myxococcales bacterium]
MVRWFVAGASLALAMVCFGCDDGGSSSGADRGADRGPIADQEVEGPAVDAEPDGEAEIDAGPDAIVDAEPDQGADARIDAATERMIDTCEQACGRYAECGRLADRFGDEATCLRQCGRIARNGRPDTWFDCLEEETCGLMHLCPVPPLTPLTCQEICDQTVTCEA